MSKFPLKPNPPYIPDPYIIPAKDEMNSSNNSSGWISVKERLPENGDYCLVYCSDVAKISMAVALYDYWEKWGVTHWMSLPKPPEE